MSRIDNINNYTKSVAEQLNTNTIKVNEEIHNLEEKISNLAPRIKEIIEAADTCIKSGNARLKSLVENNIGEGIAHKLGFEFCYGVWSGVTRLAKRGGGFCGEWNMYINSSGAVEYTGRMTSSNYEDLFYKKKRLLEIENEFESLETSFYTKLDEITG